MLQRPSLDTSQRPAGRPINPNKYTKTLRPWFNTDCRQAQHHLHSIRRAYGAGSPQTVQARRHYRHTLRKARRTYLSKLENLRIYSPAAFWKLLKPPASLPAAAPADLHAHYSRLLSQLDPTYVQEDFIHGWETSQDATITPEEV